MTHERKIGNKDKFRIAQEAFQAQSRAESMVNCLLMSLECFIKQTQVRAANSLLSITHSIKLLLLLSDEVQVAHRKETELGVVQEETKEIKTKVAALLDELIHGEKLNGTSLMTIIRYPYIAPKT